MNVRSPITMLLLLGVFTTGIFIACHKEVNQPKEQAPEKKPFTVKEARRHFYKNVRPAMALRQQKAGKGPGKLYPLWDKAQTFDAGAYQLVEVPAYYEKRYVMAIRTVAANDTSAKTALPTKEEMGNFDRLLIYKFNDGTMTEKVVTYMPDASYMGRHKYDASQNRLWALDKDFSGYLVHRTLEGQPLVALKMKNGQIVASLDYAKAARLKKENEGNAKWVEKCTTKTEIIGFIFDCIIVVIDYPGQGYIQYEQCQTSPIIEITETCEMVWEEDKLDCVQTPHDPGCPQLPIGGGTPPTPCGGDNPPCPTTGNPPQPDGVIVPMAADPILDISVYLGVFDYSKPVKVIIRTSQPVPGTRDVFNGSDLGHTFITFEQNRSFGLVRRTIGAHPTEPLSLTMPASSVQLGNDQSYGSNVQLETTISGAKFAEVYREINYFSQGNYEIRGTNAHYLGYRVAYVAGFGVPETMGTLAGLPAWNAGDFGEDMKAAGGVAVPGYPLPNLN